MRSRRSTEEEVMKYGGNSGAEREKVRSGKDMGDGREQ